MFLFIYIHLSIYLWIYSNPDTKRISSYKVHYLSIYGYILTPIDTFYVKYYRFNTRFLIASNCIKMRCSNTFFYVYCILILHLIFLPFHAIKNLGLAISQYRSCLIYTVQKNTKEENLYSLSRND